MKKNNNLSSVFGYISLASGSLWFGAYVSRLLTTFQMFEARDLSLKQYVTTGNFASIVQTTYPLVSLTFFSYLLFILSFTLFVFSSKIKLKENGWLLVIVLIVYLTLPFEAMLLSIDYKLLVLFLSNQFASDMILDLITKRITMLNSFPIILMLSYISIPYFLVFKPFRLNSKNEN
jgi:hypothetical protein